jgi:hypothetical protein
MGVIATATDMANESKRILDDVIHRGEVVEIQRHGKGVAVVRRKVGVSGKELLRRLKAVRFSDREQAELRKAMDAAGKALIDGHRA